MQLRIDCKAVAYKRVCTIPVVISYATRSWPVLLARRPGVSMVAFVVLGIGGFIAKPRSRNLSAKEQESATPLGAGGKQSRFLRCLLFPTCMTWHLCSR